MNDDAIRRILEARHHDPFSFLGHHREDDRSVVRYFHSGIAEATLIGCHKRFPLERVWGSDLFEWRGDADALDPHYRVELRNGYGDTWEIVDPYTFGPQLTEFDLHLFGEGKHYHAYRFLGAHIKEIDGISGVCFAVWAPNAERISVVGDFNHWDGRCHPMRSRGGSGVWELFIPGLAIGTLYKFELRDRRGGIHTKSDPYARRCELRPATACVVEQSSYQWQDEEWLQQRARCDWYHAPMSIYEIHLGSWHKDKNYHFLSYRTIADQLIPYISEQGFTHIELLPVTEHPLDVSWGYQTIGYYAATSRFGSPDELRYLIDSCHRANIGVILDWVPAHFPRDTYALASFDGTPLYEHEDPRKGEHRDWGTLIFNFGRNEVKNFLLSSALFWLEEFHMDGLRVDAVASMLYLDYSREHGDWVPNQYGGHENLEAITFLRELNILVHQQVPGALTIAEESTSWPMVSRPVDVGGLGFTMKWNMGWMNDTLDYIRRDPIYRQYHHNHLTFGAMYAFTENFILPFSHDEVVHMKRSMLDKMPGDEWQRFANLRLLYSYMYTMPGKKLLFMGNEFGQGCEWNNDIPLDWYLLDLDNHKGIHKLVTDLNHLYRNEPALHYHDFEGEGFQWIDCNDHNHSLLSYLRHGNGETIAVALNFTPVPHTHFRLGIPQAGQYRVTFNSDSHYYGGANMTIGSLLETEPTPWMGQPCSLVFALPALAGVMLKKT